MSSSSTVHEAAKGMDANELVRLFVEGERNFSGVDLDRINLRKMALPGINLTGAKLYCVQLQDAVLKGAILLQADLTEARLDRADLAGADLREACLRDANLIGADLAGANLREACLRDASLIGADLSGADLRHADIRNARLNDARMAAALSDGADLTGAVMPDGVPAPGAAPLTEVAIRFATHNRRQLQISHLAGCYYCLATFEPNEIMDYVDDDVTALCPRCGIDSVLGSAAGYDLTYEGLKRLHNYWF